MNLSYWEVQSWFSNVDFTIVGSGIVGLSCALHLKNIFPKSNILILERGILPQGASTKNAGFACFGSLSEILEDLKGHTEEEVVDLIKKRNYGLLLLRKTLGDRNIGYNNYGGYELFNHNETKIYETCLKERHRINNMLMGIFEGKVFNLADNTFNFKNIHKTFIYNPFEGQIDTGKMMTTLLRKVQSKGIKILNNTAVDSFIDLENGVHVKTNNFEFKTNRLIVATNGFAKQLIDEKIVPARAQVLITKPIKELQIKGTFHMNKGFYYFRNIDNRILLGGGRNLDFKKEETHNFGLTSLVQNELERLLTETILPDIPIEIEHRWSGIMGVGPKKKVILKQLSNNVFCGVRLGGMGIAIGSSVGKQLAELVD